MELLDAEKFPHIATSAHFLLSELYLPDDTDPAMPAFSGGHEEGGEVREGVAEEGGDVQSDVDYSQYSVEVQTLCLPGSLNYLGEKRSPPISATTENRCVCSLKHIDPQPIPMGYTGNSAVVQRTRSVSEGAMTQLRPEQMEMTWPGLRTCSTIQGSISIRELQNLKVFLI